MYSYAGNSPTNFVDPTGHYFTPPKLIDGERYIRPVYIPRRYSDTGTGNSSGTSLISSGNGSSTVAKTGGASNVLTLNSDEEIEYTGQDLPDGRKNGLGEPNSTGVVLNPDGTRHRDRKFGPNGEPEYDIDYGHPKWGDHYHGWENGDRDRDHSPIPEHLLPPQEIKDNTWWVKTKAVGQIALGTAAIIVLAVDDVTVIGFVDDMYIPVVWEYVKYGWELLVH